MKNISFLSEKFFLVKFSVYLNRRVFVMVFGIKCRVTAVKRLCLLHHTAG